MVRGAWAGIVGPVRSHPLVAFFLLACLFGWAPWIAVVLPGVSGGGNLPLAPLMAVLVVVPCQGREELRAWARSVRSWRAAPRWYLVAVLAPIVLHIVIVLVNGVFGAPLPTPSQLSDWPQVPVIFAVLLVLVGIGEETGWTAFAAPILLRRHGMLVAWALASAMRILWHLPLMISGDLPVMLGIVGNAAFTMVTLRLLVARGGNWSLAAVWHAMLNATGYSFLFTMVIGTDHSRLSALMAIEYAVLALVICVSVRPRVDRRRPTKGGTHVDRHASTHL